MSSPTCAGSLLCPYSCCPMDRFSPLAWEQPGSGRQPLCAGSQLQCRAARDIPGRHSSTHGEGGRGGTAGYPQATLLQPPPSCHPGQQQGHPTFCWPCFRLQSPTAEARHGTCSWQAGSRRQHADLFDFRRGGGEEAGSHVDPGLALHRPAGERGAFLGVLTCRRSPAAPRRGGAPPPAGLGCPSQAAVPRQAWALLLAPCCNLGCLGLSRQPRAHESLARACPRPSDLQIRRGQLSQQPLGECSLEDNTNPAGPCSAPPPPELPPA